MRKKRMSKNGKILVGLSVASISLFSYQNIFIPVYNNHVKTVVYVAKETIPDKTTLNANMFKPITVENDSVIKGSITNIKSVVGKQIDGSLKEGELLSNNRVTSGINLDGPLLTEVKITSVIPLKDNDNVRLFSKEKGTDGKTNVTELFHLKKVYTSSSVLPAEKVSNGVDSTTSISTTNNSEIKFYLKLTQDEVLAYETAVSNGEIVAVKVVGEENTGINPSNNSPINDLDRNSSIKPD